MTYEANRPMELEAESLITHLASGCFTVKSLSYESDPVNMYVNSEGMLNHTIDMILAATMNHPPFFSVGNSPDYWK
jgi:hypothetical protein